MIVASWVSLAVAAITAVASGWAWLRISSQNKLDLSNAGKLTTENMALVLVQNRELIATNQDLRHSAQKAEKDLNVAFDRIRDLEHEAEQARLVITGMVERFRSNGDTLEGFNGAYHAYLRLQQHKETP